MKKCIFSLLTYYLALVQRGEFFCVLKFKLKKYSNYYWRPHQNLFINSLVISVQQIHTYLHTNFVFYYMLQLHVTTYVKDTFLNMFRHYLKKYDNKVWNIYLKTKTQLSWCCSNFSSRLNTFSYELHFQQLKATRTNFHPSFA